MRMTEAELKQAIPFMYRSDKDMVAVEYGDIPSYTYTYENYQYWQGHKGTISNVSAVEAYMYAVNGGYHVYSTLIGTVQISVKGDVLCGSINVKYRGMTYSISLNLMYGLKSLSIMHIGASSVTGFTNSDGQSSPTRKANTKEIDKDVLEKILNDPLEDYGVGIQLFMEAVRKTYELDKTNCIMEKHL